MEQCIAVYIHVNLIFLLLSSIVYEISYIFALCYILSLINKCVEQYSFTLYRVVTALSTVRKMLIQLYVNV